METTRIKAALLALLLATTIGACSDSSTTPEEPTDPEEPVDPPIDPPDPGVPPTDPEEPVDPPVIDPPPIDPPDPGVPPVLPPNPGEPIEPPTDPDPGEPGNPVDPGEPEVPVEPPVDPPDPPEDPDMPDHYVCEPSEPLPIIPCQVGWGMDTPAGSGRNLSEPRTTVYTVTNLNNSGDGSLRQCVEASGPRTCVFEVSGYIDLTSRLSISNDYITIAGQTAPSPGITLRDHVLRINADDVLIQHIRVRVGDDADGSQPSERDSLLMIGGRYKDPPHDKENIVLDHLSVSWSIDEAFSVTDMVSNVTVSNNLIAEALNYSLHAKGKHSKGAMIIAKWALYHRNVIAHVDDRGPLDVTPRGIFTNNLSYNTAQVGHRVWGLDQRSFYDDEHRINTTMNNVRIPGEDTLYGSNQDDQWAIIQTKRDNSKVYIEENVCGDYKNDSWPCVFVRSDGADRFRVKEIPIWLDGLDVLPTEDVERELLANAGARPADRDATDERIINEIRTRTGRLKDCVGPETILYPTGKVISASGSSITLSLDNDDCDDSKEGNEGRTIRITSGPGEGESRTITSGNSCPSDSSFKVSVNESWNTTPTSSSRYAVEIDCTRNAGGWPDMKQNQRELEIPANYNEVMESGYTRLEEWLHSFYGEVEN
ncbi:pectate lyase [Ferrimonas marina]|uniref:Pectate lyase n=1 Tax=Ferrimonas marina TaxID=299255 RepID=A0A1M5W003_9GAMM|nr:pectate lyase [Ferrimonas marina]SHH80544.1 hypothetical protein SAMN02745129_3076 [Ferrimonas marina]